MTASKKQMNEIYDLVSYVISLSRVEEFENHHKLFTEPPEFWNEDENCLNDYQVRIEGELLNGISQILTGKEFNIQNLERKRPPSNPFTARKKIEKFMKTHFPEKEEQDDHSDNPTE
jgi:hypothetical protein